MFLLLQTHISMICFQDRCIYDYNCRFLWCINSNFNFFSKNIQNGSHMMQKNTSNLVVKTVCELNIRVKSYFEKTSMKRSSFTLSLPPSPAHAAAGSTCAWGSQHMQWRMQQMRLGPVGPRQVGDWHACGVGRGFRFLLEALGSQ